jgi:hypothetical protein
MHIRASIGVVFAIGFAVLGNTEAAAQNRTKAPKKIYGYYASPNAMYYAAPPAKAYVAPPAAYYTAPAAVANPVQADLPMSSPGYQGSWRNSRY